VKEPGLLELRCVHKAHKVGRAKVKLIRKGLTPLDAMFQGAPVAYTPGATIVAAIQAARQGEPSTVGSVDSLLTELNAPIDNGASASGREAV
jgi:hypothetical protein